MDSRLPTYTRIYRIMKQKHFFELFQQKKNTLVQPSEWDDPFENVILRSTVIDTHSNQQGNFSFHDEVYGQCWSLERESDALWRIYSDTKDAVQIRTTVGKLINSLRVAQGEWADTTCYIDQVEYLDETTLRKISTVYFQDLISANGVARTLLLKRRAFKYEREVRLIYLQSCSSNHKNKFYQYTIDPNNLVERVVADPRMSYRAFSEFERKVMKITNLKRKQIKHSSLYQSPEGFHVKI